MKHSKNHEEWGEWDLSAVRRLRSFYKQGTGRGHDVAILRRSPGRAAWIDLDFLGLDRLDRDHDQTCLIGIPWAGPACWATTASSTRSSWRWPPFLGVENGAWKIQPIWENQGHLRKINGWVGGFSTFPAILTGFIWSLPFLMLIYLRNPWFWDLFIWSPDLVFHTRMLLISWWRKEFTQFCWIGQWLGAAVLLWLRLPDHPKKGDVPAMFLRIFGEFQVFPSRSFGSAVASFTTHWGIAMGMNLVFGCGTKPSWMIPGSENHFFIQFYHLSDYTLLLGGEEHGFMTFLILGIIIPTDELIFFSGVETTNQII